LDTGPFWRVVPAYVSSLHCQISTGEGRYDFRKNPVFHFLNSSMERIAIVVRLHGNSFLEDYGPVINQFVDEVDGDARERDAMLKGMLDCVGTRERWQQRRMDVDDRLWKVGHCVRSQDAHEPGEDKRSDVEAIGSATQSGSEFGTRIEVGPLHNVGIDASVAGPFQSSDAVTVGDDHRNDEVSTVAL
jgi:hypothetical protein